MTRSNTLHRRGDQFVAKVLVSQTPAPPDLPTIGLCLLPPPLFHLQGKFSATCDTVLRNPVLSKQTIHAQPCWPLTRRSKVTSVTAPTKTFQRRLRLNQFGSHRIEVDVVANRSQVTCAAAIDMQRLVTSRKNVAAKLVANVESLGIDPQQPFHTGDQIG